MRLVRTNFTWSHAVQQSELSTHKITYRFRGKPDGHALLFSSIMKSKAETAVRLEKAGRAITRAFLNWRSKGHQRRRWATLELV